MSGRPADALHPVARVQLSRLAPTSVSSLVRKAEISVDVPQAIGRPTSCCEDRTDFGACAQILSGLTPRLLDPSLLHGAAGWQA